MNQKQPKPNDVVLGGDSPPPANAAVLGGLTGVKVRLASDSEYNYLPWRMLSNMEMRVDNC